MNKRIIQVGLGAMGRYWAQVVRQHPTWEPVAYVDIDQNNLVQAAHEVGMDENFCFSDLDEALTKVEADALLDITPPDAHEKVSTTALKAGLHVLVEKPLADSLAAARRVIQVANENHKIFMVNQDYRFRPVPRTLCKLLNQGTIGKVGFVDVEFYKGPRFPGNFRESMDFPLLTDMCIHHFDLMRYLLQTDAKSIYVKSFQPSWSWFRGDSSVAMIIEMQNGTVITYGGSWVTKGNETPWCGNWRIEGEKGGLYWYDEKAYRSGQEAPLDSNELVQMSRTGIEYALDEFYQAIAENKEPETSGRDNIKSLAMVFAAVDSAKSGRKVQLRSYLPE